MEPSDLVRSARQLAGLSQRRLGERADVTAGYVGHVEAGSRRPSYQVLARLLDACGLELALAKPLAELAEADEDFLRLSTSERLYWAVGGRHAPERDRLHPPWVDLGAVARRARVSLAPHTARSVWLREECALPVVYAHRVARTVALPLRRSITVLKVDVPVPDGSIPVGVSTDAAVWAPTPAALALQPELASDAPRLRAVDRYLHESAPRDTGRRRRPAHRVTDPFREEWRIRQNRSFGPLKELPSTLDRREWRAGGIVSFAQWLAKQGYPDPRHPEPVERGEDDDLTLAELLALRDELTPRDDSRPQEAGGAA